jgi:uncharacterized protein
VVDFGAFVDLGIKETALIHISELSDHFVKNPMDAVKVGDVLEFRIIGLDPDRRRISLSRKTEASPERPQQDRAQPKQPGQPGQPRQEHSPQERFQPRPAGQERRPKPVAGAGRADREAGGGDDGAMYNPFAEAFKKMQNKEDDKKRRRDHAKS